jgi:ABC-type antimicrobial peptide transport system permease subunit
MVAHFPVVPILEILGSSALLAVTLSFLGVLYPALVASRMQPAIALRAEP